jgi:hypothetical protein
METDTNATAPATAATAATAAPAAPAAPATASTPITTEVIKQNNPPPSYEEAQNLPIVPVATQLKGGSKRQSRKKQ